MALTNQPQPFYIKTLPGMNTKSEPLELAENWVEVAQNCRFEPEPGAVTKREPISYFNTAVIAASPIVGLYRYYKSDGTTKFITVCADTVYVGADATGTFTAIRTLTSTGKRMCFKTYKDLLIGSNGYDNIFCYDGNSTDLITWELGSCKAKAGTGTGISRTAISYQVTLDADAYICGAVSNTIASVTNKDILLSNIPLGPVGTTNRKIYRKSSETGGDYRLITTIANNTATTYTDTTADASAGDVLPGVTDDMPKGAELQINRERLFITRDPTSANRIYFSNPYLPGYIQQTTNIDYLDISPDDNDEIMGIPIVLGVMLCIKKNTVRKLYVTGPQLNWYAEDPFTYTGTPAPWSITQTPYGVAYLGWDHWYMYTGAGTDPIIDEFDTLDILPASYADVVGFWDSTELLATYTDLTNGSQVHDRVMRYNFKRKALAYDTLKVNCFASKKGDAETGELYYGSSQTGYVYKSVNEDLAYKLSTKTECNAGTKGTGGYSGFSGDNVYVGGTESNPYIEIGTSTAATAIPDNICILWDTNDSTPGTGWTEVTGKDGRFIYIDNVNAVGTTGDAVKVSGQLLLKDFTSKDFRIFKKNNTTTEYEFPDGSIVGYDQTVPPVGYEIVDHNGKFVTLNTTIGVDNIERTWGISGYSGYSGISGYSGQGYSGYSGYAENIENILEMVLIKKIGEADTWDGSTKYVYCLQYAASAGTSWTDVTSTYTGNYLRIKTSGSPAITDGGDVAREIDWVQHADPTYSYTASGGGGVSGTGANTRDGDFDTYYGCTGAGSTSASSSVTASFALPYSATIVKVVFRIKSTAHAYSNNGESSHADYKVQYYGYSGVSGDAWYDVPGSVYTQDGGGSAGQDSGTVTLTGLSLTNVGAIKAYASATAGAGDDKPNVGTDTLIYELQAFQEPLKRVSFHLAKKILGKMKDYNSSIETATLTAGTWTSPALQLTPDTLKSLWWNESLVGSDDILIHMRTGATKATCEAAGWSSPGFTDPNAQDLASITENIWVQYKIEFTCTDTTVSNPRVYSANGFLTKITYSKGATPVETAVEYIYDIGFRNFNYPSLDKIFQKINLVHEGTEGSFTVYWETENASGNFVVSLATYPKRWDSYFPSTAMGKEMKLKIYKNDAYSFKLKEIMGFYSPQPLLI